MSKIEKIILKILIGLSDQNISFNDLRALLVHLGFIERIKGSHHIFIKEEVEEIINLQPIGRKSKTYQGLSSQKS